MVLGGERSLASLERSQDLVTELNGVAKGFQARGKRCVFVMSKLAVASTGRENQVVVRQGNRSTVHEAHLFRNIYSGDCAL